MFLTSLKQFSAITQLEAEVVLVLVVSSFLQLLIDKKPKANSTAKKNIFLVFIFQKDKIIGIKITNKCVNRIAISNQVINHHNWINYIQKKTSPELLRGGFFI